MGVTEEYWILPRRDYFFLWTPLEEEMFAQCCVGSVVLPYAVVFARKIYWG